MYKENCEQKGGRKKLEIRAENAQNEQNRVAEKNPVTMQLVLAEKPSVAQGISKILGANERCDDDLPIWNHRQLHLKRDTLLKHDLP